MRIGPMRHRVTVLHQVQGADDPLGEPSLTWAEFATVWGEVSPLSGRQYMEARQAQSEVSHRVRIRYLPGVAADMRVQHDGRMFQIEAVLDMGERKREMHLMCVERTGD